MDYIAIACVIGCAAALIFIIYLSMLEARQEGYKQGQIDAIKGIIKYVLIEFEDGVREYREKTELKDLKPHKIMTKKYNIIPLNGFMYAVDKEAQINVGDKFISQSNIYIFGELDKHGIPADSCLIIATNDHSLKLPLLPAVEDDTLERITQEEERLWYEKTGSLTSMEIVRRCVSIGYKAASSKQYTEADVKRAMLDAISIWATGNYTTKESIEHVISQSLKPKPVAVEIEIINNQKTINYHKDLWVDDFIPAVDENNFVKVKQWYYE